MRVAVDSNILLYAEGLDDDARKTTAKAVLANLDRNNLVLPVQVLGELFNVLRRKFRWKAADVNKVVAAWRDLAAESPSTTSETLETALDLATEHDLQIWDAIILAASAEAGCRMLISEDMHDGFVWRGVTVVNPFAAEPHPLLADALRR